ncbi:metallophosphoesterase [Verrucomicrobia bacterium LW23]|nr:metallophosphoesterase [Verrucomicrobia bacterium LW23]
MSATSPQSPQPQSHMHRRSFLRRAAAGVAGLAGLSGLGGAVAASAALASGSSRTRTLRIAYLTDVHMQPERRAPEGLAACLRHMQALPDKPALVLGGGDFIHGAMAATRERAKLEWDIWTRVLRDELNLPMRTCLGNHDIWGWNQEKSGATGAEPDYGKKWAMDVLGQKSRYYAFSQAGWRFIALDSIQPGEKPGTYVAYLDAEQKAWLKEELLHTPPTTPILIWSHVPLISALLQLTEKRATPFTPGTVGCNLVHSDGGELSLLFTQHPNVRLCLSGHLHMVEALELRNVMYRCAGSVCGQWWKGLRDGFAEGYSIVDLYDDGTHDYQYLTYGWKAEPDPAPYPAAPAPAPAPASPPAGEASAPPPAPGPKPASPARGAPAPGV